LTGVRYSIEPVDPGAHLYEVRVEVENPDPDGQRFSIPAWIPGSYVIRDYARNVVSARAESDGVAVALRKPDKSTWVAAPVSRPLTLVLEIFALDESVRGAHLDGTHAYFNGPCVFPAVAGQEQGDYSVEIKPPPGKLAEDWRVATSMRRDGADKYGFGRYAVSGYDELIDHPVECGQLTIGEFEAAGIPHAIAIRGRVDCDMTRLCHDLETLCDQHLALLGAPADLDRYLFLLYAPGEGYGGLEHRWSSSLVCARDNLPRKGQADVDDAYGTFLGLASHEYFHLWNVKRMRPAAVASSALDTEAYTELLWVFEGITSYYDDLQLLRSGLIDRERYLTLLGRTMTRVERGAGRRRQSIAESSFEAWTKFYKQDANAPNAIVSYYAKGSLVALCLDLKIRAETDGRRSLDDVMRECWRRFGETGRPLDEADFEALAAEVTALDLGDFFDAAVRGTGDLPLEKLLALHGVILHRRAATGRDDRGGVAGGDGPSPEVWFGAALAEKEGSNVVLTVANDSPAERAGLSPGDVVVALGGLRLTASNRDRRLTAYAPGDRAELAVFRGDELLTLKLRFRKAPENTIYLEVDERADGEASRARTAWLNG
jgi:predicted metalloprotease with PDZ domain